MARASTVLTVGKARQDARYVNVSGDTMTGNLSLNGDTFATQGWVTSTLIDSAPGALNTLNELAAALGDDANFSTTVTNNLATKLNLSGGTMTGALTISNNNHNNHLKLTRSGVTNSWTVSGNDMMLVGGGLVPNGGGQTLGRSDKWWSDFYLDGVLHAYKSDSEVLVQTYNTSATGNPAQFFISHNNGGVNIGNNRGDITISAGTFRTNGNTYLGNGNGDQTHINDILYLGATDSGDAHFYFGENSSNWYGLYMNWDSGHRVSWYSRNAGTNTRFMYFDTNNTTYLNWERNFNMSNRSIHYVDQLHFNDNVRFLDEGNDSYLRFKYGDATTGGIKFLNGSDSIKGYVYADSSGFGLLSADGTWSVRTQNGETRLYHNTYFESDIYAYTIYDRNDANYYLNPNAGSVLRQITMPYISNGGPNLTLNNGGNENWNVIQIRGGASNHLGIGHHKSNRSVFGRAGISIHFDDTESFRLHTDGWDTEFEVEGGGNAWLKNNLQLGGTLTANNFRAGVEGSAGSYLSGVSSIAFRSNTNTWDSAANHGIRSTHYNGNFGDSISINSYNDITLRLDTNSNNSGSYLRIMNDSTGNNVGSWFGYDGTRWVNRLWGRVGIDTEPRTDGYRLALGGSIHMNNNSIDYVHQVHFNDNVRFYDDGNDSYLNFKYGDANTGAIRFRKGDGAQTGMLYSDANGFGLLSADGSWAVKTTNSQTTLSYNAVVEGDLTVSGGQLYLAQDNTKNKIYLWGSDANYTIGMSSGIDYGHIGAPKGGADEFAMTFKMNNDSNRGFWWGHSDHGNNRGAMSLTTDGQLVVAKTLSIGEGDSQTAPSNIPLYVNGSTSGEDVFAVDGVNGRLFSVTDDLSDSLFSVNTIAGLPIIEAFADQSIKLGPFTAPVEITSAGELKVDGGTDLGTAVTGATVSNDTITFTRANGSTFAVTTSDANTNRYLSGADFNATNGVLTLTVTGTSNVDVDLDGRYLTETLANARYAGVTGSLDLDFNANQLTVQGDVTAVGAFVGNGSGLTNLPGTPYTNAETGQSSTVSSMRFNRGNLEITMANGEIVTIPGVSFSS